MIRYKFTCLLLILTLSTILIAQTNSIEENSSDNNSLFGAIENFRNTPGFGMEVGYKGEIWSNLSGGMEKRSVYLDNFDIIFDFNLEELLNWNGVTVKTHFLGNHGGDPSEYAGASQGISNIAAFETWKLYQVWIEKSFLDNKFSVLAGLYDLNSEFDVRQTSSVFINPSHGIGADYALTGLNGPSIFPYTSFAVRVKYNFSPNFNIKTAAFDGVPGDLNHPHGTHISFNKEDGMLLSAEASCKSETEDLNSGYYNLSLGGWYYTSNFEKINEDDADGNHSLKRGNYGIYLSGEKYLLEESDNSGQGLSGFVRLGYADSKVNHVNGYFGAGLQYTGLIPGRDEDVFGIALSTVHNNDRYISLMSKEDVQINNYEHIFELTYILNLAGWLSIQPDLQYVMNPVDCQCNSYSLVYGTRVQLSL